MKKIVMTIVAAMTFATTFAANNEKRIMNAKPVAVTAANMNQNYDMRVNYRALASTLGLNAYQMEVVEMIHGKFVNDMFDAEMADESVRAEKVRKAANTELMNMKYVLNEKQYRKFNTLLNITLVNRGLLK